MMELPRMARISLDFAMPQLADPVARLKQQLADKGPRLHEGQTIAIAVGSRGICLMKEMVRVLANYIQSQGATAVIMPAMGSHGGATAEGQSQVLASYGISEQELGIPVISTMDTVCLGNTSRGIPVYVNKVATQVDGIFLINRVKSHTDYHGVYESGLVKQMAIGLGSHKGAQHIHSFGIEMLEQLIVASARVIMEKTPVLMGVAIVENARDGIADLQVLPVAEILTREPELLQTAKQTMPLLPFENIDVLVIEEMGKNISGIGIDPNVTGRTFIRYQPEWGNLRIGRLVCLDLTPETYGNAQGVGVADVIPRRLYDKIDFETMYVNVFTNRVLERAFIPIIQKNDLEAIKLALHCCGRPITGEDARLVQIKNTLHLQEMFVSLPLLKEIKEDVNWAKEEEFDYGFSSDGELLNWIGNR